MPQTPVPPGPALWPPGPRDMAPGARTSTEAAYGAGLDVGALRLNGQVWEIMWPPGVWIAYDPGKHHLYANMFSRYGPGWSFGPAHNMHSECVSYFRAVHGRDPSEMERRDCEHSRAIFKDLRTRAQSSEPSDPTRPDPTRPDPTTPTRPQRPVPPPPPETSPSLSPIPQRVAELTSLIDLTLSRAANPQGLGQLWQAAKGTGLASLLLTQAVTIKRAILK
jgi:hypothetical protein